ncbi:MAG: PQQ-binding-like beta-propeller repeat protein [Holosporales bacterium]|jgi:outer membrane protein assembly factor BamB|nr:PQQ-binding-like beta-propeller repeat protein [Holosporales bacterium]
MNKTSANRVARLLAVIAIAVFTGCTTKSRIKGTRELLIIPSVSLVEDKTLLNQPIALPPCKISDEHLQMNESSSHEVSHSCFDVESAEFLWNANVGCSIGDRERLRSNLVAHGGRLFGGTTEGNVFAVDLATHKILWRTDVASKVDDVARIGGLAISRNGDIIVATSAGNVFLLDAQDGSQKQKVYVSSPIRSAPTVSTDAIFIQGSNNSLIALDHNLNILWSVYEPSESLLFLGNASPTVKHGIVFAASSTGDYRAYDVNTGHEVWYDYMTSQFLDDTVGNLLHIYASQVVSGDYIFTLGHGGRLVANIATSGARAWSAKFSGLHTPAVIGEWLFTTDDNGCVYCIEKSTGKVRWTAALPLNIDQNKPQMWTNPIIVSGTVSIATEYGDIVFFDVADGHVVRIIRSRAKEPSAAIIVNKHLYVLSGTGYVYTFG